MGQDNASFPLYLGYLLYFCVQVNYKAEKWLLKNMDPLNENVVSLMQQSSDPFIVQIWKDGNFNILFEFCFVFCIIMLHT